MVRKIRKLRGDKYEFIPIEQILEEYHFETNESWSFVQKFVNKAFDIDAQEKYEEFLQFFHRDNFDIVRMKNFYKIIKIELAFFDDDILRYIAFIAACGYFEKVGNPTLEQWLNATDLFHATEMQDMEAGFTLKELLNYKLGGNAIRNKLTLFTWRVIVGN